MLHAHAFVPAQCGRQTRLRRFGRARPSRTGAGAAARSTTLGGLDGPWSTSPRRRRSAMAMPMSWRTAGSSRSSPRRRRSLEIRARDPAELIRLAWHLGNRHLETEIGAEMAAHPARPRHRRDARGASAPVIAEIEGPFQPEGGAYAHGAQARSCGHDHDHDHEHHGHGTPIMTTMITARSRAWLTLMTTPMATAMPGRASRDPREPPRPARSRAAIA